MSTRSIVSPVVAQQTSKAEGTYVKVLKLAVACTVTGSETLCYDVAVPLVYEALSTSTKAKSTFMFLPSSVLTTKQQSSKWLVACNLNTN